jgi:hypothetical protein
MKVDSAQLERLWPFQIEYILCINARKRKNLACVNKYLSKLSPREMNYLVHVLILGFCLLIYLIIKKALISHPFAVNDVCNNPSCGASESMACETV